MQLVLPANQNQANLRQALLLALGLHISLLLALLMHFHFSQPPVLESQLNAPIAASLISTTNNLPVPPIPALPSKAEPIKATLTKSAQSQAKSASIVKPETQAVVVPKPNLIKPITPSKPELQKLIPVKATPPKQEKLENELLQQALASEQKQLQKFQSDAKAAEQKHQAESRQEELERQLNQEQQQLAAAQAAATRGEIDKYKVQILQAISQQWIVPPNLPEHISCRLLIRIAPKGMVLNVTLVESSGDMILDRSAVAAVYKASPLPVPDDDALFSNFRELSLTVKPNSNNPVL